MCRSKATNEWQNIYTFSRRTLFVNDPFSLVGKDVGQPICLKVGEMTDISMYLLLMFQFTKNVNTQPLNTIHKEQLSCTGETK
jgi:hypothetical protein